MEKITEVARVMFYLGVSMVLTGVVAYGIIIVLGPLLVYFTELVTA